MAIVRKAVFPVAGLGTRFLPATKANAKEMMPVVDKPLIQYAVEEAVEAGCDQLVFITGRGKRAIADHFDTSFELEHELESRGKTELLDMVRSITPPEVSMVFIRQARPLGLGHAVALAQPVVGDEPFAILLADDLMVGEQAVLSQMADAYAHYQSGVIAVQEVPHEDTKSYGIVEAVPMADRLMQLQSIVEKPDPAQAPSNMAVVGRYILPARIFYHLEQVQAGAGGEIQLTDAIAALLAERQVLAYQFQGRRYDCGDKLGYLVATLELGLTHPEIGADFKEYLIKYCAEHVD